MRETAAGPLASTTPIPIRVANRNAKVGASALSPMQIVHTTMAITINVARRHRSASAPNGMLPATPTSTMAAPSHPRAVSLTPKSAWMPSRACESDRRSPCSRASVPASATTG